MLRNLKHEFQTGSDVANYMSVANNVSFNFTDILLKGLNVIAVNMGAHTAILKINLQSKQLELL